MSEVKRILGKSPRMSDAVVVNGMVYVKGITPRENSGNSVQTQAADVLSQIEDILRLAGTAKENLVAVSVWLKDIKLVAGFNEVYDNWVIPGYQPVRACVQASLAQERYLVEVQVIANVE